MLSFLIFRFVFQQSFQKKSAKRNQGQNKAHKTNVEIDSLREKEISNHCHKPNEKNSMKHTNNSYCFGHIIEIF